MTFLVQERHSESDRENEPWQENEDVNWIKKTTARAQQLEDRRSMCLDPVPAETQDPRAYLWTVNRETFDRCCLPTLSNIPKHESTVACSWCRRFLYFNPAIISLQGTRSRSEDERISLLHKTIMRWIKSKLANYRLLLLNFQPNFFSWVPLLQRIYTCVSHTHQLWIASSRSLDLF
jgi:hypothetical protein